MVTPLLPDEPWARCARRPRLLIVDDQAVNVRIIHSLFKADCDVFMASAGEQVMQLCHSQLPDIILLDLELPGIDGYEVCRQLKTDEATADIPVIFITGHRSNTQEARGFELGAVDFIAKPIVGNIVRARVRVHLQLKLQSSFLRTLAMADGLTGLANRRMFDAAVDKRWRQCAREQLPFSILMLDVDYFKRFNDRYGHQAGDDCLREVAKAISKHVNRPLDLAARYGGEEFACLLPATDAEGALALADAILDEVRALGMEHGNSDAAPIVTLSAGFATLVPDLSSSSTALLKMADEQLYRAKDKGRNQACGCGDDAVAHPGR